jgi:hypothetical protein
MGKDDKNSKLSRSGRLGQRKPSNNQPQPKVDCILCFKDPKPRDDAIKAKFAESNGSTLEITYTTPAPPLTMTDQLTSVMSCLQ